MSAKALLSASVSAAPKVYIEDVFSTYLYTGNGTIQTITNEIDLSGEGGMVWIKSRGVSDNLVSDTARGNNATIRTNTTDSQVVFLNTYGIQHNNNGFTIQGENNAFDGRNNNGTNYCSWTFRKAPKFFDVVTYTGTGSNTTIAHNLGSVPGSIIVKRTDTTAAWAVYHRSLANTQYLVLNTTAAAATGATWWNSTTPTSSVFSVGTAANVNASGGTYVAYVFAHDAGGFGTAGTDNVVSCGQVEGVAGTEVNLGWEPQWVLIKRIDGARDWFLVDNMRGLVGDAATNNAYLSPNLSSAEDDNRNIHITPTGFKLSTTTAFNSDTHIYIAIRRGPMKTPTVGTSVFAANRATPSTSDSFTTNFPVDLSVANGASNGIIGYFQDRLRGYPTTSSTSGNYPLLVSTDTYDEATYNNSSPYIWGADSNTAVKYGSNLGGLLNTTYAFRRAPGFFDVVAYTGTFSVLNVSHNLTVAPQLMIIKQRSAVRNWIVYSAGVAAPATSILRLNTTDAVITGVTNHWNSTAPTSSVFTVANDTDVNDSGGTYIAYLFATLTGISKVGTYTGTGTTKQIDCGFTAGARFVLIKRTDSTGDWYVWDTARGIISGNDPYLLLNSTAAEVTNTDYIDPLSSGFEISSTAPAAINANGGSYIFLSIA